MMTRSPIPWRAVLLSCAMFLLGSNIAPLHAQQRAGAHIRSSTAKLPSRKNRERSARPQSANPRLVKVGVRAGDTLASLAERFNITPDEVARLNNLNVDARLRPGQQIIVPRVSSSAPVEAAHGAPAEQQVVGKRLSLVDGTSFEVDDVWEDAQGVWFRRGGITNLIERERVRQIERGGDAEQAKVGSTPAPKVKIVEVSAGAETKNATEPVWIY
ncbi:MAG: LysM peptidoglycan-binding domain-containing protein, partial [Acidobacteria bacterium]|nr:LysM peptidoglycan-binding domain-containing protein [Acidobacteriota bacterium]